MNALLRKLKILVRDFRRMTCKHEWPAEPNGAEETSDPGTFKLVVLCLKCGAKKRREQRHG